MATRRRRAVVDSMLPALLGQHAHGDADHEVPVLRMAEAVRTMTDDVLEMVRACQIEIRDTADLQPDRAAELLTHLSALIGNVNDFIRAADAAYAAVLIGYLDSEEKANRARIRAEASPEYQRKREARDARELVLELIRSLKYFLRSKEEEMRLSR